MPRRWQVYIKQYYGAWRCTKYIQLRFVNILKDVSTVQNNSAAVLILGSRHIIKIVLRYRYPKKGRPIEVLSLSWYF